MKSDCLKEFRNNVPTPFVAGWVSGVAMTLIYSRPVVSWRFCFSLTGSPIVQFFDNQKKPVSPSINLCCDDGLAKAFYLAQYMSLLGFTNNEVRRYLRDLREWGVKRKDKPTELDDEPLIF